MEKMDYLMISLVVSSIIYYILRESELAKTARFVNSDKVQIRDILYIQLFVFFIISIFAIAIPYTFEMFDYPKLLNNDIYINYYIALTGILLFFWLYFSNKTKKIKQSDSKAIKAKQLSYFDYISNKRRYEADKKFLSEVEKKAIKKSNKFIFYTREDDLTISKIELDKDVALIDYSLFIKALNEYKIDKSNMQIYLLLTKKLNKNIMTKKIILDKEKEYKAIEVQQSIFKSIQNFYKNGYSVKLGQLYSLTENTLDYQFLNFLDCYKTKKYNSDAINYAIYFLGENNEK